MTTAGQLGGAPDPDRERGIAVTWSRSGDVGVVEIRGDMDLFSTAALDHALIAATAKGGAVVVDLSDVAFMDSSGLASLIRARRRIIRGGRGFAVVGVPAEAGGRRIGRREVRALFKVHASRAEAVASLST